MRVIVTGSRKWTDSKAVFDALWDVFHEHGAFQLIHGACSTGAPRYRPGFAGASASQAGCTEKQHPPDWEKWRLRGNVKAAGPERNARMVEAGADLVLAFPLPEGTGTQGTIKLAKAAGIKVKEIES